MIREPVVAGQFYPDKRDDLKETIKSCFAHKYGPDSEKSSSGRNDKRVFGVICPHAGYEYSGPTACHSYRSIAHQNPRLVVIIGPNHFGIGIDVATMKDASWKTPIGTVQVDSDAAMEIIQNSETVEDDTHSHSQDHSLEVQVPMLQHVFGDRFQILPIILRSQDMETAMEVGRAVSEIAKGGDTVVVGSSDFTHYEKDDFARMQDMALIEPILKMDVGEFYRVLKERKVSACGYGAIASTMVACKSMGATRGELLSYATSGDISGDAESVVGYGAIRFV